MDVKAVIFDMDGTLFDTERVAKMSWNVAAKHFGFTIDENIHNQLIGLPKGAYSQVVEDALPKEIDRNEFEAFKQNYFISYIERNGLPLKPGVFEILQFLKHRHISIALATSTWRERVDLYFKHIPIHDYFDVIVSGDEVKNGKPKPEIFEKTQQLLGIDKNNILIIEDSINGILAATCAGMDTIVVPDCIEPSYELLKRCLTRAENLFQVKTIIEHL